MTKMKIALVQCPSWAEIGPPYAMALLSACLRQKNHDVYCFDLNIKFYNYLKAMGRTEESWGISGGSMSWVNEDYVINLMEKHKTHIDCFVSQILDTGVNIIGFTVQDTNRIFSEKIARKIKEKDKNKIIIFGGPSCFRNSLFHMNFLKMPYIDAICLLEGELAFIDLINKIKENGEVVFCQGFTYKDKSGQIINCGERGLIEDLDTLPFADFSDFELREYEGKTLPIATSRGCRHRCVFCHEAPIWKRYRSRSAKNIYNEMSYQLRMHPEIKKFFFNDSLINGNINILNELADLIIKNGLKVYWGGQARIREEMNFEFLEKLHKAGLSFVSYGLESGAQGILNQMRKSISLQTAEEVIRDTHRAGIDTSINIIVGFPNETEKEVLETAEFLKRNIDFINDIYFNSLILTIDSPLYNYKDRFGIEIPEGNKINLWHTGDGDNDYQMRLGRIDFYKSVLKGKSTILTFDYYLTSGNQYYERMDFEKALECYFKAKKHAKDGSIISLIENKIKDCQEKRS